MILIPFLCCSWKAGRQAENVCVPGVDFQVHDGIVFVSAESCRVVGGEKETREEGGKTKPGAEPPLALIR